MFIRYIPPLFYTFFFFLPLAMFLKSSELFELQKMVLLYFFTIVLTGVWILEMIVQKRCIFRRTLLDIPLLFFLGALGISTLFSIDFRSSFFGYYGRFHGGLASMIAYAFLYWIYVSTMDRHKTMKVLQIILLSSITVSLYAIAQRFGVDQDLWVQDVQSRVFSTLGQPNWLAAWVVAVIPLTWAFLLNSTSTWSVRGANATLPFGLSTQGRSLKILMPSGISLLLFITLLLTKSRSGILGFLAALGVFCVLWLTYHYTKLKSDNKASNGKPLKTNHHISNSKFLFLLLAMSYLLSAFLIGTPWSPSIAQIVQRKESAPTTNNQPLTTSLESAGTDSGEIRKIVWKGAIDAFFARPFFGYGPETFAFFYYMHRPLEHNLTSEWEFLYNKAHNEYLNYLSTTGTVGTSAYFFLLVVIGIQIFNFQFSISNNTPLKIRILKNSLEFENWKLLHYAFFSGFLSILITNFFGFSVVPVFVLFILYPAFAYTLTTKNQTPTTKHQIPNSQFPILNSQFSGLSLIQKSSVFGILLLTAYCLLLIIRFWLSDYYYAQARGYMITNQYDEASLSFKKALDLSPNEPVYLNEFAILQSKAAVLALESGNKEDASTLALSSIEAADLAQDLSPSNILFYRDRASILIRLSSFDKQFLYAAQETLSKGVEKAPTDAKMHYNYALSYVRTGDLQKALELTEKTVEMKPNYKDARYALALMYLDLKEPEKAGKELKYILENIDPEFEVAKKELAVLEAHGK